MNILTTMLARLFGNRRAMNEQLSRAVREDEREAINGALIKGANPNFVDDGRPLIFTDNPDTLHALLAAGAHVKVRDSFGASPVQSLVDSYWESDCSDKQMFGPEKAQCFTLLLRHGADPALNSEMPLPLLFADALAIYLNQDLDAGAHAADARLLVEVYKDPEHYNRGKIGHLIQDVWVARPEQCPSILQRAFERVVENTSMDTSYKMLKEFLAFDASTDWPLCILKATQDLEAATMPAPYFPQAVRVLHHLIEFGADPFKVWPELGGRSPIQCLAEHRNPAPLDALRQAIAGLDNPYVKAEAEARLVQHDMETSTRPAVGRKTPGRL